MGHTHRYQFGFKKKKNQVKSPSIWSCVPETGSDLQIGSGRDSGCDRDSMVGTTLTIEREIEDVWSTRDAGVGSKREDQPSSNSGKRQKTSASHEFQD